MKDNRWYKNKKGDRIWWLENPEKVGEMIFSFDRKTEYNLFRDYPEKLTKQQRRIFERENPYWADFFTGKNKAIKVPDGGQKHG